MICRGLDTLYEVPNLANQISRNLEVFDRKLKEKHYILFSFAIYMIQIKADILEYTGLH